MFVDKGETGRYTRINYFCGFSEGVNDILSNSGVIPVVILEDSSGSTKYMKTVLDTQVQQMVRKLKQNPFSDRVELSAVLFDEQISERAVWKRLHDVRDDVLDLSPAGETNTGAALKHVLSMIEKLKQDLQHHGGRCAAPIVLMLTDGPVSPGEDATESKENQYKEEYMEAALQIKKLEQREELRFAAVGIIQTARYKANMDQLKKLTVHPERIFQANVEFWEDLELDEPISWLNDQIRYAGEALEREPEPQKYTRPGAERRSNDRSRAQEPESQHWVSEAEEMPVYEICLDDVTLTFFGLKEGMN